MPQTFKPWNPAAAELELLHEYWLARLPPNCSYPFLDCRPIRALHSIQFQKLIFHFVPPLF
jgi:hypothetical protein